MELEWGEVSRSARDTKEKWEELKQELMELRARRDRWICFWKGRIEKGAGTNKGVAKEEGLLRRVLEKVTTLARAVVKAREQVVYELAQMRELERLQELAMLRVGEMHQRLLEARDVEAERFQVTCRVGTAKGAGSMGTASSSGARGTAAAGARAGSASNAAAAGARGAAAAG
eukprot:SAG11_NODE_12374_length_706_cov_1.556837_1_plen_172_part_10